MICASVRLLSLLTRTSRPVRDGVGCGRPRLVLWTFTLKFTLPFAASPTGARKMISACVGAWTVEGGAWRCHEVQEVQDAFRASTSLCMAAVSRPAGSAFSRSVLQHVADRALET